MNLNWIDILVAVFLILSIGRGFLRGLIRCLFDIISLFLAVVLAFYWYTGFAAFADKYIKMPGEILHIVSFAIIWTAVYFLFLMLGNLIHKFLGGGLFGPANSLGGALLGAAKGLLTMWILLYFLALVPLPEGLKKDIYEAPTISKLIPVIKPIGDSLFNLVPGKIDLLKEYIPIPEKKTSPKKEENESPL
ncbi:MAG: CvpA family protein [Candidatus Margulisiibacteriota bacterium]